MSITIGSMTKAEEEDNIHKMFVKCRFWPVDGQSWCDLASLAVLSLSGGNAELTVRTRADFGGLTAVVVALVTVAELALALT